MVDPRVYAFVKTQLAAGKSKEDITAILITQGGWNQTDIDEVFKGVTATPVPPVSPMPPVSPAKDKNPPPVGAVSPIPAMFVSPQVKDFQQNQRKKSGLSAMKWIIGAVVLLLVVGGIIWIYSFIEKTPAPAQNPVVSSNTVQAPAVPQVPENYGVGPGQFSAFMAKEFSATGTPYLYARPTQYGALTPATSTPSLITFPVHCRTSNTACLISFTLHSSSAKSYVASSTPYGIRFEISTTTKANLNRYIDFITQPLTTYSSTYFLASSTKFASQDQQTLTAAGATSTQDFVQYIMNITPTTVLQDQDFSAEQTDYRLLAEKDALFQDMIQPVGTSTATTSATIFQFQSGRFGGYILQPTNPAYQTIVLIFDSHGYMHEIVFHTQGLFLKSDIDTLLFTFSVK
jgi:hypothetical protein